MRFSLLFGIFFSVCLTHAHADGDSALRRELAPLKMHPVSSSDRYFTGAVEASAAPQVAFQDGLYSIDIPLGAANVATCFLSKERDALADGVASMQGKVLQGSLGVKSVVIDAGQASGLPFIHLESMVETQSSILHVKIRALGLPGNLLICAHDNAGLSRTFSRIVDGLAASIKTKAPSMFGATAYRLLFAISANGSRVGVNEILLSPPKDGKRTMYTSTSMLVPHGNGVLPVESVTVETSNLAGVMLYQALTSIEGKDEKYRLEVKRAGTGKYSVKGKFSGKPVQAMISHSSDVVSGPSLSARIGAFAGSPAGNVKVLKVAQYSPTDSHLKMTDATFTRAASNPKGPAVESLMGGLKMWSTVDAQGWPIKVEFKSGDMPIQMTRLLVQGAP